MVGWSGGGTEGCAELEKAGFVGRGGDVFLVGGTLEADDSLARDSLEFRALGIF